MRLRDVPNGNELFLIKSGVNRGEIGYVTWFSGSNVLVIVSRRLGVSVIDDSMIEMLGTARLVYRQETEVEVTIQ